MPRRAAADRLKPGIAGVRRRLGAIRRLATLEDRLVGVEEAVARIERGLAHEHERTTGVETGLAMHEDRMVGLDRQMSGVVVELASLASALDEEPTPGAAAGGVAAE